MPVKVISRKNR